MCNGQYLSFYFEMRRCYVPKCPSNKKRSQSDLPEPKVFFEGISFFRFPRDPELKKIWLEVIPKAKNPPTKTSAICSKHFTPDCMKSTFSKPSLTLDAVPTIFSRESLTASAQIEMKKEAEKSKQHGKRLGFPVFSREDPKGWFQRIERTFALNKVVNSETKFKMLTKLLPYDLGACCRSIMMNTPEIQPYNVLKDHVINHNFDSISQGVKKVTPRNSMAMSKNASFVILKKRQEPSVPKITAVFNHQSVPNELVENLARKVFEQQNDDDDTDVDKDDEDMEDASETLSSTCPSFACCICLQKFARLDSYEGHLRVTHDLKKSYVCMFCSKLYASSQERDDHVTKIHPNREAGRAASFLWPATSAEVRPKGKAVEIKCIFCIKEFRHNFALKNHMKKEHQDQLDSFKCSFCKKGFLSLTDRLVHEHNMHRNTGQVTHFCPNCPQKFTNLMFLRRHIEKIHQLRQVRCPLCGEQFINLLLKDRHMDKDHNMSRCPLCPGKFILKSSLANHLRDEHKIGCLVKTPSERKVSVGHKCHLCSQTFSEYKSLHAHVTAGHSSNMNNMFPCSKCWRSFPTNIARNTHKMISHPIICEVCQDRFANESDCESHEKMKHGIEKVGNVSRIAANNDDKGRGNPVRAENSESGLKSSAASEKTTCTLCSFGTQIPSSVKDITKSGSVVRVCKKCKPVFEEMCKTSNLKTSVVTKSFSCPSCEARFPSEAEVRDHAIKHQSDGDNAVEAT